MKIKIETKELNNQEKQKLLNVLFEQFKDYRKSEYEAFISISNKKEVISI